jgi:hypothetical protein
MPTSAGIGEECVCASSLPPCRLRPSPNDWKMMKHFRPMMAFATVPVYSVIYSQARGDEIFKHTANRLVDDARWRRQREERKQSKFGVSWPKIIFLNHLCARHINLIYSPFKLCFSLLFKSVPLQIRFPTRLSRRSWSRLWLCAEGAWRSSRSERSQHTKKLSLFTSRLQHLKSIYTRTWFQHESTATQQSTHTHRVVVSLKCLSSRALARINFLASKPRGREQRKILNFSCKQSTLDGADHIENNKILIASARARLWWSESASGRNILINFPPFIDAPMICKQFFSSYRWMMESRWMSFVASTN